MSSQQPGHYDFGLLTDEELHEALTTAWQYRQDAWNSHNLVEIAAAIRYCDNLFAELDRRASVK